MNKSISRKKLHYAWVVCIGCGLILFCNAGLAMGGFSVYLPHIAENGDFTNMQTSLLMTIRSLAAVCGTTIALRVTDKLELRGTAFLAGLLCAASFFLHSIAGSYFLYCLAVIIAGFAYGMGSILISGIIISRWFNKSRGLAMGIAVSGTGIALAVVPPLATVLIEAFGLQSAFRIEAVFIIGVITLATLLVKNDPADLGLEKYGGADCIETEEKKDGREVQDPVLTSREHKLMILAVLLIGAGEPAYSQISMLLHANNYSAGTVSTLLSYGGIMIIVGKIIYGRTSDRLGSFTANGLVFGATILGQGLSIFAGLESTPFMFLAVTFFGLSIPLHTVGLTTLAADTSNSKDFPVMLKTFQTTFMCGSLIYSVMPGFIADVTGSYVPSYVITTILSVICSLIIIKVYNNIGKRGLKSARSMKHAA